MASKVRSKYNSLKEFEKNVVLADVSYEAEKFYLDKTKDFKERVEVFSKYGLEECFIWHPADKELAKIFEADPDNFNRYETVNTAEYLHGHLEGKLYKKSDEEFDAEYQRLMEKLFAEGVAKFTFDW